DQLLMYISNDSEDNIFEVAYYKYNSKEGTYTKDYTIFRDRSTNKNAVSKAIYSEENNMLYVEVEDEESSETYIYYHSLDSGETHALRITDCFWGKDGNMQFINKDMVAYYNKTYFLYFGKKTNGATIYDSRDFVKKDDFEIKMIDVNDNMVDIYVDSSDDEGAYDYIYRVDIEKYQLMSEQKLIKSNYACLQGKYVIFEENGKYYMENRETLSDKREIPCTEDLKINDVNVIQNYLFAASGKSIYRIDLKTEEREKVYEYDKTDITCLSSQLHIIDYKHGFVIGKKIKEDKKAKSGSRVEYDKLIWFDYSS
ncbi:MAG: hypothetical protein K6G26_03210, partial [Lachnospiraceae bacterium]|nr:hypothetical protein [Lachnospiraceae bacterium]